MKHSASAACLVLIILTSVSPIRPAQAKDLTLLAGILARGFLAQTYGVVCTAQDPAFLQGLTGPLGTVHVYAQHLKDEILALLDQTEAAAVLETAAGTARSTALHQVRELAGTSRESEIIGVITWCRMHAKPFVRNLMTNHDADHDRIVTIMNETKQDY